jgi:hypothetical protein
VHTEAIQHIGERAGEHPGDNKVREDRTPSVTASENEVRDRSLPGPVLISTILSIETGGVEYDDKISESEAQL